MSSIKSPPAKKRNALDRDHVVAAEYPHGFRKLWPRKKAWFNRSYRRKVRQLLPTPSDDLAADPVRREPMPKWGVVSVRERVRSKLLKREAMIGAHKARRSRRADA